MKAEGFFYYFLQFTWGLILNLVGIIFSLALRREKHFFYRHAFVTYWNLKSSMAIGMFIFLEKGLGEEESRILYHEYGHTYQSAWLGPVYFLVIAAPSVFWANTKACRRYRQRKEKSYYSFYPEKWADHIGQKMTRPPSSQA